MSTSDRIELAFWPGATSGVGVVGIHQILTVHAGRAGSASVANGTRKTAEAPTHAVVQIASGHGGTCAGCHRTIGVDLTRSGTPHAVNFHKADISLSVEAAVRGIAVGVSVSGAVSGAVSSAVSGAVSGAFAVAVACLKKEAATDRERHKNRSNISVSHCVFYFQRLHD